KSLGASNKTATIIMQKGFKTEYPVPYIKWYKMAPGVIDGDDLLESVMSKIEFEPEIAVPLRDDVDKKFQNSPWLIAPENEMQALKGLVGKSQFRARKGIDTSLNGLYWIEILSESRGRLDVRTTPENSRKNVPKYRALIEQDL